MGHNELHAGNVLSAKDMLAKYPNDVELAMKEYAKQFVIISYQKSLVSIGCSYEVEVLDEQFLVTDDLVSKYKNQWVFIDKQSIMRVIDFIK